MCVARCFNGDLERCSCNRIGILAAAACSADDGILGPVTDADAIVVAIAVAPEDFDGCCNEPNKFPFCSGNNFIIRSMRADRCCGCNVRPLKHYTKSILKRNNFFESYY